MPPGDRLTVNFCYQQTSTDTTSSLIGRLRSAVTPSWSMRLETWCFVPPSWPVMSTPRYVGRTFWCVDTLHKCCTPSEALCLFSADGRRLPPARLVCEPPGGWEGSGAVPLPALLLFAGAVEHQRDRLWRKLHGGELLTHIFMSLHVLSYSLGVKFDLFLTLGGTAKFGLVWALMKVHQN